MTYGGIWGIIDALYALNGVDDGGGTVLGAGNLLSEITMANYMMCVGRIPGYADANAKWYTSKWVWAGSMMALALAGGGNTAANIIAGANGRTFAGFPVVIVDGDIFPKTDTNSQCLALFGDMEQSSTFGDRRTFTVSVEKTGDDAIYDRISVIASERFDINNHDLDTATAAGPVVELIAAAS